MAVRGMSCPESVSGHDGGDRDGKCNWCRQQVAPPVSRPSPKRGVHSDLYDSWRYVYDPDWGSDPYDF